MVKTNMGEGKMSRPTDSDRKLLAKLIDRKDFSGKVARTVMRTNKISEKQRNILIQAELNKQRDSKSVRQMEEYDADAAMDGEDLANDRDLCDSIGVSPWGHNSD